MNFISRFKSMPRLLMVLVMLGLIAPLLSFVSVLTGNIVSGGAGQYAYGSAKNIYEFGAVILLSVPIFVASLLILKKRRMSIHCYLVGWVAICLSPLCLSDVYENLNLYLIELSSYGIIGIAITFFLLSKHVDNYFSGDIESSMVAESKKNNMF